MKHLVTMLAMFLLMGNQTLAQESQNTLEQEPEFYTLAKPVLCGTKKVILAKIEEYGELPAAAWIEHIALPNKRFKSTTMFFINEETGTSTVVQDLENNIVCMISQGTGAAYFYTKKNKKEHKTMRKYYD